MAVITAIKIARKSVPREEGGTGITYENLAILRLKTREKVQGILGVFTALASMYLLSILGADGPKIVAIHMIGVGGGVTIGIVALIEGCSLAQGVSSSDNGFSR